MTYACPLIKIIKESGETIILRRLDPMRVPIILTIILKLNVFNVIKKSRAGNSLIRSSLFRAFTHFAQMK